MSSTSGVIVAVETSALAVPIPVVVFRTSANSGAPVLGSAASTANAEPLAGWPPTQPSAVRVSVVVVGTSATVPYEAPEVTLRPASAVPLVRLALLPVTERPVAL